MQPRARILGHPVHLILIVFPLGLLATSFFFDVAWMAWGREELSIVSNWLIFSGVIGGGIASIFGFIDWLAIPRRTRAWRMGAWHGGGNLLVSLLFAFSWTLRRDVIGHHPSGLAIALSAGGVLLIVLTGWLGSELADRMEEV